MISRTGVFGLMPGSVVKSKSSPSRRPCTLIVFPAWTVPFTDHTPLSMFFIAAFTSGSGFPWPDPVDFSCGLANAEGAFANRKNAAIAQIKAGLMGTIFFISVLFGDSTSPGRYIDQDGSREAQAKFSVRRNVSYFFETNRI